MSGPGKPPEGFESQESGDSSLPSAEAEAARGRLQEESEALRRPPPVTASEATGQPSDAAPAPLAGDPGRGRPETDSSYHAAPVELEGAAAPARSSSARPAPAADQGEPAQAGKPKNPDEVLSSPVVSASAGSGSPRHAEPADGEAHSLVNGPAGELKKHPTVQGSDAGAGDDQPGNGAPAALPGITRSMQSSGPEVKIPGHPSDGPKTNSGGLLPQLISGQNPPGPASPARREGTGGGSESNARGILRDLLNIPAQPTGGDKPIERGLSSLSNSRPTAPASGHPLEDFTLPPESRRPAPLLNDLAQIINQNTGSGKTPPKENLDPPPGQFGGGQAQPGQRLIQQLASGTGLGASGLVLPVPGAGREGEGGKPGGGDVKLPGLNRPPEVMPHSQGRLPIARTESAFVPGHGGNQNSPRLEGQAGHKQETAPKPPAYPGSSGQTDGRPLDLRKPAVETHLPKVEGSARQGSAAPHRGAEGDGRQPARIDTSAYPVRAEHQRVGGEPPAVAKRKRDDDEPDHLHRPRYAPERKDETAQPGRGQFAPAQRFSAGGEGRLRTSDPQAGGGLRYPDARAEQAMRPVKAGESAGKADGGPGIRLLDHRLSHLAGKHGEAADAGRKSVFGADSGKTGLNGRPETTDKFGPLNRAPGFNPAGGKAGETPSRDWLAGKGGRLPGKDSDLPVPLPGLPAGDRQGKGGKDAAGVGSDRSGAGGIRQPAGKGGVDWVGGRTAGEKGGPGRPESIGKSGEIADKTKGGPNIKDGRLPQGKGGSDIPGVIPGLPGVDVTGRGGKDAGTRSGVKDGSPAGKGGAEATSKGGRSEGGRVSGPGGRQGDTAGGDWAGKGRGAGGGGKGDTLAGLPGQGGVKGSSEIGAGKGLGGKGGGSVLGWDGTGKPSQAGSGKVKGGKSLVNEGGDLVNYDPRLPGGWSWIEFAGLVGAADGGTDGETDETGDPAADPTGDTANEVGAEAEAALIAFIKRNRRRIEQAMQAEEDARALLAALAAIAAGSEGVSDSKEEVDESEPVPVQSQARSAQSFAGGRAAYLVKPGETLESIAFDVFADSRISVLIRQINKETIAATLVAGQIVVCLEEGTLLYLPSEAEVKQYLASLSDDSKSEVKGGTAGPAEPGRAQANSGAELPAADRAGTAQRTSRQWPGDTRSIGRQTGGLAAARVDFSPDFLPDLFIDDRQVNHTVKQLAEACRIVESVPASGRGPGSKARLELRVNGSWVPVVSYEIYADRSFRHEFTPTGQRRTLLVDLPPQTAGELAENDLALNWRSYSQSFVFYGYGGILR